MRRAGGGDGTERGCGTTPELGSEQAAFLEGARRTKQGDEADAGRAGHCQVPEPEKTEPDREGRGLAGKSQELQGFLAGKELRIHPKSSGKPWLNLKRGWGGVIRVAF